MKCWRVRSTSFCCGGYRDGHQAGHCQLFSIWSRCDGDHGTLWVLLGKQFQRGIFVVGIPGINLRSIFSIRAGSGDHDSRAIACPTHTFVNVFQIWAADQAELFAARINDSQFLFSISSHAFERNPFAIRGLGKVPIDLLIGRFRFVENNVARPFNNIHDRNVATTCAKGCVGNAAV